MVVAATFDGTDDEDDDDTDDVVTTAADASEAQLKALRQWNCERIDQANGDLGQLARKYGQAVDGSFTERMQEALQMCSKAANETSSMKAASMACCAWGDVLMRSRECCNVPGPPYCISHGNSKLARMSVALAAVLAAVAATVLPKLQMCCRRPDSSGSCLESFFAPSLFRTPRTRASMMVADVQSLERGRDMEGNPIQIMRRGPEKTGKVRQVDISLFQGGKPLVGCGNTRTEHLVGTGKVNMKMFADRKAALA
ncbi:hypothetical protein AK812_SmicGene33426 [Symbiodinium microadriaticum]|uniref:Uncharacterized protein n=1 Tax=Symbiodinium microadriaticum TaxID=2951 RepID=A0A1Q9CRM3_SYMMI|nr:hypothetical protein AK812_SmicGene33426 [Symbiodinium microadriaticum]